MSLKGFFFEYPWGAPSCSLTPYIYVIVNNVLSKMLNQAAFKGEFGCHPLCQEVGLTHLSFADDIFVFSDGSRSSIRGILITFEKFARLPGLKINIAKSALFVAGRERLSSVAEAENCGISIGLFRSVILDYQSLQSR